MPRGPCVLLQWLCVLLLFVVYVFFYDFRQSDGVQMMNAMWLNMWKLIFSRRFFPLFFFLWPTRMYWYRLTILFQCLSLLSFVVLFTRYFSLLFIYFIDSWMSFICWYLLNMHMSQFVLISIPISFIDFVKYTICQMRTYNSMELVRSLVRLFVGSFVCIHGVRIYLVAAVNIQVRIDANMCRVFVPFFKCFLPNQMAKIFHASNNTLKNLNELNDELFKCLQLWMWQIER